MADGGEIAELFATLGLRVNQGQWAQGNAQIGQTQAALGRLGASATPGLRQAQIAFGQITAGAGTLTRMLAGVAPMAHQAGSAAANAGISAEHAGGQAAHGWDAAATALKGYLLYLGGHFGYEHLIKSNQEMQDTTIGLAAMIQGKLGVSFEDATGKAKELYGEWQKFSMVSGSSTTAEFVEFGKSIAASTFAAKGNLKDLNQLTEQGMIAAKVLAGGRNAGYAAMEISEMLSGNVSNRMMFVKQLLSMINMTEEQFRALDDRGRIDATLKALNSPAFKDAGKAMGGSFSGVKSTLEDIFQIATRRMGEPVFGAITNSLHKLNDWLLKNQATIDRVAGAISDGLAVAWDLVVQLWNKAYDIFDRNRDVIGRIAEKVGTDLYIAFQLFVAVLDETLNQVDKLLGFFDHGFGKFLLDALLMPNLLMMIADLLDRIGVSMQNIKDIASFNIFGKAFDLISGGGDESESEAFAPPRRPLPGINLGDTLSRRAQELSDQAQRARTDEERNALIERANALRGMAPAPFAPALPAAPGGGPVAVNVSMGDINVHAPNADPVAVGDQVRKVFHEELGNTLRKTMDVYG